MLLSVIGLRKETMSVVTLLMLLGYLSKLLYLGSKCIFELLFHSFHCGFNTFATGGSDGHDNIWVKFSKSYLFSV